MAASGLLSLPGCYRFFQTLVAGRMWPGYAARYIVPRESERILDLGCGSADILDYLGPVEYVGVDLNPRYIKAARRRYPDRTFFHASTSEFVPDQPGTFDKVLGNGILHHLSDAEVLDLLRVARQGLKPDGKLITVDPCYLPDQSWLARFVMGRDRGRYIRSLDGYLELIRQVFTEIAFEVRDDLCRLPYSFLITRCSH